MHSNSRKTIETIVLLLALVLIGVGVSAQDNEDPVDTTLEAYLLYGYDQYASYAYLGNGVFCNLRSCRVSWLGVRSATISYNEADSMLHFEGEIFDNFNDQNISDVPLKLIVGSFMPCDSTIILCQDNDWAAAYMDIAQTHILNKGLNFNMNLKVAPNDYLCFVPVSVEDSLGESSISMMPTPIYRVVRFK